MRSRPALRREQSLRALLALVPDRPTATMPRARWPACATTPTTLKKADGKGKWWDGLDPQELYNRRSLVIPDGITDRRRRRNAWHDANDRVWHERPACRQPRASSTTGSSAARTSWTKYHPDLLYFDNTELPLGQTGLDIAAHYLQRQHRAERRQARGRGQRQEIRAQTSSAPSSRTSSAAAQRDLARALADRHLHRRLALQPPRLRTAPLQDRQRRSADARATSSARTAT